MTASVSGNDPRSPSYPDIRAYLDTVLPSQWTLDECVEVRALLARIVADHARSADVSPFVLRRRAPQHV